MFCKPSDCSIAKDGPRYPFFALSGFVRDALSFHLSEIHAIIAPLLERKEKFPWEGLADG